MALAIAHFAFGVGATSLLIALVAPRFRFQRTALFLGGVWALLPDLHYGFPGATIPELLAAAHNTPRANLFFLHHRLDALSAEDSPEFAASVIAVAFCAVLASEVVGYLQPIVVRAARERLERGADAASGRS